MNERVFLVTGATSGIGRAAALGLARHGARVVLVGRDRVRTEVTAAEIARAAGNDRVATLLADLSSRPSIRQAAAEYGRRYARLDGLINSAALLKPRRLVSPDGLELMFATNHLGPFLLTNLLLDLLKASAPAVVFTVTAPSTTKLDFADLQGERRFRAPWAFGASKTGNLLFTFALARRLRGSGVVANAYHPGLARTRLMREAPLIMRLLSRPMYLFAASPERAVAGLVGLTLANAGGANGEFFHREKIIRAPAYTRDEATQEQLWRESVRLTGLGER